MTKNPCANATSTMAIDALNIFSIMISLELAQKIDELCKVVAISAGFVTAFAALLAYYSSQVIENDLRQKAGALQETVDAERAARINLEKKFQPRKLNDVQSETLLRALQGLSLGCVIEISSVREKEPTELSEQFFRIFERSGASVKREGPSMFIGAANTGVRISIASGPFALKIKNALQEANIDAEIQFPAHTEPGVAASIDVMPKPPHL